MITVILTDIDNIQYTFSNILSVKIQKEYFTPYTSADISFLCTDSPSQYKDICVSINGHIVHFGLIDTLDYCIKSDSCIVKVSSKSFSSLLIQNQPVPGMMYNVSLNSLMDSFIDIPHITYENNDTVQNYIFLKDNADLWDAVVNISYKLYGIYPYIRNSNEIRISETEKPVEYSLASEHIISNGMCLDYTKIISNYHMQDIQDNYDIYSLDNPEAVARNIVRHKQIALDKQYLNDPERSMRNKLEYSMRGHHAEYFEYFGFNGEDIHDTFDGKYIDRIIISGSSSGIKTKIFNYK